jgi:hypothetical protein
MGEGLWSGVVEEGTGFGSFPGVVEFGPVGSASEPDAEIVADLSAYVEAFFTDDADQAWGTVSERCKASYRSSSMDGLTIESWSPPERSCKDSRSLVT